MMYANNFAAAILVNGKVLREFGDSVYAPFGSEYKIRLKNLSNTRVKAKIEIDGSLVTDGGLVLDPDQTTDLERFIRNGNLNSGNRFKFIERSSKIEEHRGISLEDGIITIRYEFEVPLQDRVRSPLIAQEIPFWNLNRGGYYEHTSGVKSISTNTTYGALNSPSAQTSNVILDWADTPNLPTNEAGITVEGSLSYQKFSSTHWRGSIGGGHVLNIRLLGETKDNAVVRQPVTVKTKAKCKTCGTLNKATAKFCSECGTSLQIV